jgi:hypothetical protein
MPRFKLEVPAGQLYVRPTNHEMLAVEVPMTVDRLVLADHDVELHYTADDVCIIFVHGLKSIADNIYQFEY